MAWLAMLGVFGLFAFACLFVIVAIGYFVGKFLDK
jgi:hypothetical protein